MNRSEIDVRYTWKVEDIFESDEAWEAAFAEVEKMTDLSAYQGTLNSVENILAFLKAEEEVSSKAELVFLYAYMKHDQDTRVPKYQAYFAKTISVLTRLQASASFAEPEFTALSDERLNELKSDPRLADYDYMIERIIKNKPHVLTPAEEQLLAMASEVFGSFSDVFGMIDNANLDLPKTHLNGEEVQLTHGVYGLIMRGFNREERKEAFEKYYKAYSQLKDTLAANYFGNVKATVLTSRVRKYPSSLQMALSEEDVDPAVYSNLIESVHKHLPVMHRYMRLRKAVLGEQHMYDVYVPLVEDAELKLPFDQAYDLVVEGLAVLGKDYQDLLEKARRERWIDVYENEGKKSGAYSIGMYGVHPYALLNYQESTKDIFTVAHEMGHTLHTYFSNKAQPYAKSRYRIFVAEVASTVNEVLLAKYLYKNTTDVNFKKFLLNYYIDMFRMTLFRQTQFAEFEQIAHEMVERGEPLNNQNLSAAYYKLNKEYYGDGVDHDEIVASEWSRIPHFYSDYYVYKYATGIISAMSIARRIMTEGEPAVKDYFAFLSSGSSDNPVELLKIAGIDLTETTAFDAAMAEFAETVGQFAEIMNIQE